MSTRRKNLSFPVSVKILVKLPEGMGVQIRIVGGSGEDLMHFLAFKMEEDWQKNSE